MADEKTKPTEKKEETTKKIAAKPLPVDKEKTKEIEEKMKKGETLEEKVGGKPTEKTEEKKEKPAEKKKETPKITKKDEAVANGVNLPVSKKHSMYICKFIKNKKIDDAIADLEKVAKLKKAVPFKGEIPHRKGNIERGRYPVNAAKYFINLLKGLKGNAITNQMEIEETKIYIASASWANRPMRRGGRLAKRTNVILKAREFPIKEKTKKIDNKKENKEEKK
jgi:ribosomal protein L22